MRTLVMGLGNPILTDDGVGVRIAQAVRRALPHDTPVVVGEASVGGLGLMELLLGYDRVILIDAMVQAQTEPGRVRRLNLDDLRAISPTQHSASAHDTSLVTALDMARRMALPVPEQVVIYAVEVENITEFGEEPTPAVARAIPQVAALVLAELMADRWLKDHPLAAESHNVIKTRSNTEDTEGTQRLTEII